MLKIAKHFLDSVCVLLCVLLITAPVSADVLGGVPFISDGTGSGMEDTVRTGGDISYTDPDGVLQVAKGNSENILLYSEDTSNWTGSGPWTQTVAVTVGWWQIEAHLDGATITVEADTATIDASASATYETTDQFYCSSAGDVTVTTDTADPKGMLYAIPSGMEYGQDLTVVGITKANPGVVTITGHGLSTDDWVYFSGLTEMTELNGYAKQIIKLSADTFSINDTSGYTAAETTGGTCANLVPNYTDLLPSTYTKTAGTSASIPAEIPITAYGLQIDPESGWVNLNTYSYDIDSFTGTTNLNATTPTLVADPYSTTYGYPFIPSADNAGHYAENAVTGMASGSPYCVSVFVRPGTPISGETKVWVRLMDRESNGVDFNITDRTIGTAAATDYGIDPVEYIDTNGNIWTRIWASTDYAGGSQGILIAVLKDDNDVSFAGDNTTTSFWAYGENVTPGSFPLPYLVSNGSMVAAEPETAGVDISTNTALRNALGASGAFTFICEIVPGYDFADYAGNPGAISCGDSNVSLLYTNEATNDFRAYDGTTVANSPDINPTRGNTYYVAVRGDTAADGGSGELQVSAATTIAGLALAGAHGTKTAYDGMTLGNTLWLGYGNEYPFEIKDIWFFDEWLADAQLPGAFADHVFDIDSGSVIYKRFTSESVGAIGDSSTYQYNIHDSSTFDIGGIGNLIDHITAYENPVSYDASNLSQNSIYYSPSYDDLTVATGVTVPGQYDIVGDSDISGSGTYSDSETTSLFSTDPKFVYPQGGVFMPFDFSSALFKASEGSHIGSDQRPYGGGMGLTLETK